MISLYWIPEALIGILPTLWMVFGLGLPWAYALLSTRHWQSRTVILAVALAIGPAWMTAWMLILGVVGAQFQTRLFTPEIIFSGSLVIALIGLIIAWKKHKGYTHKPSPIIPLAFDEKLIISMIAVAVIIRWIHTAFWTFTAYDALWVYGFQGRLYFLEGFIPHSIDYYPQFLQLQYTYVQVMIGAINDHAARMVIPMMHIGSILAAYLLGARLFNRRVGLFLTAIWSLHPYVGQWSFIGDLEMPLTFSFTMAAVFFLSAWVEKEDRTSQRHDALIAGLMLGIALFTKPTAGAFIWGVVLLVMVDFVRVRFSLGLWLPRFRVAFWTGIACIPLGSVWYIRNLLLGHDAVTFPPDLWLTLARRSGDHFNWIVLAVIIGFVVCARLFKIPKHRFFAGWAGIMLLLVGALPSNPTLFPHRYDPPYSYITVVEAILIIVGMIVVAVSLLPDLLRKLLTFPSRSIAVIGWAMLLALPYFVTWFYSYSYHYRLGFAIVPLMILPTAVVLARWFITDRIQAWSRTLRRSYYVVLVLLSLPGIIAVAVDVRWSSVWLLNPNLDSDERKYQVFNPALMEVYFEIIDYIDDGDEAIIIAPGEQRLHFFFPQMQILDKTITDLNEFEAIGATHFIYGTHAGWAYERAGIDPESTQMIASLGRIDRFEEEIYHNDATFRYELYYAHEGSSRFRHVRSRDYPIRYHTVDVLFGDSLRFTAEGISPPHLFKREAILITTAWQALQAMHTDYVFIVELFNRETSQIGYQWLLHVAPYRHGYYATNLWDVGEVVRDEQFIRIPSDSKIQNGNDYIFRLRVLDPIKNQYLPVYIDGRPAGDFFALSGTFKVGR